MMSCPSFWSLVASNLGQETTIDCVFSVMMFSKMFFTSNTMYLAAINFTAIHSNVSNNCRSFSQGPEQVTSKFEANGH